MKFDFIIGNPPYQEEQEGDNKNFAPPIYHRFIDGSYELADKVELIHPARFLFDAGSTPKNWNRKMLNDPHLKVIKYEAYSANIFPNQDIYSLQRAFFDFKKSWCRYRRGFVSFNNLYSK